MRLRNKSIRRLWAWRWRERLLDGEEVLAVCSISTAITRWRGEVWQVTLSTWSRAWRTLEANG